MADIFVSYAHEDAARAQAIATALQGKGWSVWWDPEVGAGHSFVTQINIEIAKAGCVVVLWSRNSVTSPWVMEEAHFGKTKEILCPVLIDRGPQLPVGFALIKYVDITEWNGDRPASNLDKLFAQVERLVGPPNIIPEPAPAEPPALDEVRLPRSGKPIETPPASVPPDIIPLPDEAAVPAAPRISKATARQGFIDFSDVSWIDFPVVALLAAATAMMIGEVFARSFSGSTMGLTSLMPLMFSSAAVLGGAIAIRNGGEIQGPIAILLQRYLKGVSGPLNHLCAGLLFTLVTWLLYTPTLDSFNMAEETLLPPTVPLWPWKVLLAAAFGAMALASLAMLAKRLRERRLN